MKYYQCDVEFDLDSEEGEEPADPNYKILIADPCTKIKDPENEYDKEAIKVEMEGLGRVGYVANSAHTVQGESMSAGRLYDKIGDTATGTILYVIPQGVICYVNEETVEQ